MADIATKCLASPQENLTVNYKITVAVGVFFITISPTISNAITFPCPLSADYITVSLLVTFGCQFVLKLTFFYFEQALIAQLGMQGILGTNAS